MTMLHVRGWSQFVHSAKTALKRIIFPMLYYSREAFYCVVCGYSGPFAHKKTSKWLRSRLNAKCPGCSSLERHRFQWHLLNELLVGRDRSQLSLLHFAPEPCLEMRLRPQFGAYVSADLFRPNVDQRVDVRKMPMEDNSFDVILCSMVLHYVEGFEEGLREINRVLKPGGLAMMPVPMIHQKTCYEPASDSVLNMVVEPGPDFYESYQEFFDEVQVFASTDYDDAKHFYLEQTDEHPFPMRLAHQKYADTIPVSRKALDVNAH
jgi:SAM-dependent methyltransferase